MNNELNNELNNEMNNGLNDTNKVSRKLTIPKIDLLEEGRRILAEQGTGMDHIFKKQVAFKLGTEYKGFVEEKKEEKEKNDDEDDDEEPSKPAPLVRQSSLHPTISEQMVKCEICNTMIIPNILQEKNLCVWCKMNTGVYDTCKEKEETTSSHEGLNKLLGMYSKYKELRVRVEEILKQPNHPFYDITTVEEVFDCLTFNEVDEMVFTFNENKNIFTDS